MKGKRMLRKQQLEYYFINIRLHISRQMLLKSVISGPETISLSFRNDIFSSVTGPLFMRKWAGYVF